MHREKEAQAAQAEVDPQAAQAEVDPQAAQAEVDPQAMMVALAKLAELTEPILDAVAGHKAQAAAHGFTTVEVDAMGVAYHQFLLAAMLQGAKA